MNHLVENFKKPLHIAFAIVASLLFFGMLATPTSVFAQDDKVYTVVDQMPEIKGGLPALYKKIKYPKEARRKGISGRVYLQVIVDKSGNVQDPKVLKGIGGGCGEAAIEALKKTKFKPGKQAGKAVKVKYSLPVTFRIEG